MLLQLLWSAEPWSIQRSPRHRAKALGQASPGVSSVPVQAVALTCSRGPANARAPVQQGVESPGDKRKLLLLPAMLLGWEKEVHIPSGGEGTEQGSPTSWVSALITGLVDKRGMTAAVVHLSSCFLCDFFFFCIASAPNATFWLKQSTFLNTKFTEVVLFQQQKLEIIISDWSECGFSFAYFSLIQFLYRRIDYLHRAICKC